MTERMSAGFALFNRHVNDAGDKAKQIFLASFGQDKWDEEVQPLEDAGIMSIFDMEPTPFLSFYITTVMLLVNGDVMVKEKTTPCEHYPLTCQADKCYRKESDALHQG